MIQFNELFDLRESTGYADYVEYFDPTPQYLYDNPYLLMSYDEWLEEEFHELFLSI